MRKKHCVFTFLLLTFLTLCMGCSKETEEIYLKNGSLLSKIDEVRQTITQSEGEISFHKSSVSVAENDILHNNENIERIKGEIEKRYEFITK